MLRDDSGNGGGRPKAPRNVLGDRLEDCSAMVFGQGMPEFGFPGLRPGDRWCLCAPRWQEALEAGRAPRVVLRATHEGALDYSVLADLQAVRRRPRLTLTLS